MARRVGENWRNADEIRLGTATRLQVGRYGEYFVKMEFTPLGFDVYGTEVDDKGIDLVVRKGVDQFYDVQVKTVRPPRGKYIFFPKHTFELRDTLLAALPRSQVESSGKPPVSRGFAEAL
jgi:hypothetical protein